MANRDTGHLGDDDLLLFLDGEVDKANEAAIGEHLAACWSCRARRDELQAAITTVVHAMDELVLPDVPPPPGSWEGLEPQLARLDEQLNAERLSVRWRTALVGAFGGSRVHWVAAATAVAGIAIAVVLLQQRTVTADELLARARPVDQLTAYRQLTLEERQGSRGPIVTRQRIEIWQNTTTHEKARRLFDERNLLIAGEWTRADGSRTVYRRQEAPNREDGPSAVAMTPDNVWRIELAASTFAAAAADPGHTSVDEQPRAFVLSSPFGPGQANAMSLTLTRAALHPIAQSFTFGSGADARSFRIVENLFDEIAADRIPLVAFAPDADLTGALATAPAAPARPAAVRRLSPHELLGLEVDALVRLDGVEALLGEQVNVTRTDSLVRIDALVGTPERKSELLHALDSLVPRWGIDLQIQTFEEAQQRGPVRQDASPVVRSVEMMDARAPVYDDLKRYFAEELARKTAADGPATNVASADPSLEKEIQAFTGRVLEHSLQARLHARALTQAAARVSAAELATLTPDRAQAWRALIRDHAAAFGRETESLRLALQPIFFATPPATRSNSAASGQDFDVWQTIARLFELASAHDVAVGQAFAVSTIGATPVYLKGEEFWHSLRSAEELATRLQTTLATLRNDRP